MQTHVEIENSEDSSPSCRFKGPVLSPGHDVQDTFLWPLSTPPLSTWPAPGADLHALWLPLGPEASAGLGL